MNPAKTFITLFDSNGKEIAKFSKDGIHCPSLIISPFAANIYMINPASILMIGTDYYVSYYQVVNIMTTDDFIRI